MTIRVGGDGPAIPVANVDLKPAAKTSEPKASPSMTAPVDSFEIPARNPFDAWGGKPGVLHEKQTLDDPQNEIARAKGGVSSAPADVTNALDEAAKTELKTGKMVPKGTRQDEELKQSPELKAHYATVKKGIASGDYKTALDSLRKANTLIEDKTENGLGPSGKTMERQLEFLAAMQGAKIKADYPPSEQQLVQYFGTLQKDPAGARAALEGYTQSFHVHIAEEKGIGTDIVYKSKGPKIRGTDTENKSPDQWSEVNSRPAQAERNVGRQLNDCEGFALISEKLMKAAGFEVVGRVIAAPNRPKPEAGAPGDGKTPVDTTAGSAHEMVLFKHKGEKGSFTVTSNDGAFKAPSQLAAVREGFAYASGERKDGNGKIVDKGNQTGKESFFLGPTSSEAMANLGQKENQIK